MVQVLNSICIFSNDFEFIKNCVQLDIRKKYIFVEKGKVTKKIRGLILVNRLHLHEIDKLTLSTNTPEADVGLMFGFGIKLPRTIISKHKYGVINAHPGSLKLYRGRHPIGWALIERQAKITLTFHKITKDFDLGAIIKVIDIQVTDLDTEKTLINKVRLCFSKSIFDELLSKIDRKNEHEIIKTGRYLPSLAGRYDDIQSINFSSEMLIGISRAKVDYGGILLNNQRAGFLYRENDKPQHNGMVRFKCADNRYVYSERENDEFTKKT